MTTASGAMERKRGDTYADEFEILSETTGLVMDITGYSFVLTLDPEKLPANADNNLYALTGTITDAANGLVEFAPSVSQADQLGDFFYDIEMTDDASRKRTIESDEYKYIQDISK